jgi:hypothetical protein
MNTQDIPPLLIRPQQLSARFSLDRWDLIRCRLWMVAHNRFLVLLSLAMSLGVPLLNMRDPEIASRSVGFRLFYVVFFTAVMFAVMALFQIVVQFLWMLFNKNRGVLGAHELEIRDEGLLEKTDVNESLHRWSGFGKIGRTRRHLFIFVGGNIVHYVPFRCFPSKEDAKRFEDEVRRRSRIA